MLKQYKLRNYKFILVILVITLNTIGGLLVASARPSYQNKQILGMAAGILLMVFVSLIDYRFILKFSWLIYFAMIGLLLAVMLVGDSTGGAQRWIDLGFMKFQPSEVAKIMVILFFAYYFIIRKSLPSRLTRKKFRNKIKGSQKQKGVSPWTQAQAAVYPAEVVGALLGGTTGENNGCDCLTNQIL